MKKLKLPFFLPVVFFCLTTCQSFNAVLQEPRVSLDSVDISGISIHGLDLVAHVDVENPNAFSVPVPNIDWELFINTASFINGVLPGSTTVKGRGKTTVDLPLHVTYEGLYKTFSSIVETKEAAYTIALGVRFPLPVLEKKVFNFDFSGTLPLPQIPKLSPGSVRFSKLDFSGLELAWDVNIENPNKFPIPFPGLSYDYAVNGVPVVKSSLEKSGEIAAGAAGVATISLGVVFADILKAAGIDRNAGEAPGNLALAADIPIPALQGVKNGAKSLLEIPGTLPIIRKPEVSFLGITRKSPGAAMEFVLTWEVDNKNSFALDITEFNYDFKVNNNNWAKGVMTNPPEIKARGKTAIPLTVSVSAVSVVRELVNIISGGTSVSYSCAGNMSFLPGLPGLEKFDLPLNLRGTGRIREP